MHRSYRPEFDSFLAFFANYKTQALKTKIDCSLLHIGVVNSALKGFKISHSPSTATVIDGGLVLVDYYTIQTGKVRFLILVGWIISIAGILQI